MPDLHKILRKVAKEVRKRSDCLRPAGEFPKLGVEGWFKIIVALALHGRISRIRGKGVDVLLRDGTEIELRAGSDLYIGYLVKGITEKPTAAACLFLGDGRNPAKLEEFNGRGVSLLGYEVVNDGERDWFVGVLIPEPRSFSVRIRHQRSRRGRGR